MADLNAGRSLYSGRRDRTRGRHDKAMNWLVRNPRNGIETNFLFPV